MRAKSLLLLLIALGCGVVASVAVSQVVLDQKGQEGAQTVGILFVTRNISAASRITPDSIRVEQWPVDKVPQGALFDLKQIEGKFAKQPIYANEPLIEQKLANKGKEVIVPDGYRVFDIQVSDQSGGSGYIGPGDRVDVFGFFEKGVRINASKSVKVMENLEVFMVDGVASIDPDAPAAARRSSSTIQLLVKDKQYAVLDTASNLGKLKLALRPPEKVDTGKERTDEGEQFIAWLKETETKGLPSSEQVLVSAPATPQQAKPTYDHEMLIVTPEASTKFRWKAGESNPKKVEDNKEFSMEGSSGISSGYFPPAFPNLPPPSGNRQNGNTNSGSSPSGDAQGAVSGNSTKSANSKPNMNWDPNSGTWQVGGFKASYPPPK